MNEPVYKVFIAQKMTGLTTEQVEARRDEIIKTCIEKFGDAQIDFINHVEFLDQYHVEFNDLPTSNYENDRIDINTRQGISMLGQSLRTLATADLVIFDEDSIQDESKGALSELSVCSIYEIPYVKYQNGTFYIDGSDNNEEEV